MKKRAEILIADDRKSSRKAMKSLLGKLGHKIEMALDGKEALQKIFALLPDMVIIDFSLPGVSGIDVIRRLKANEETRAIPAIIVAAADNDKQRIKAMEVGADDYMVKPLTKLELRMRVSSLLRLKGIHDERVAYARKLESRVVQNLQDLKAAVNRVKEATLDTIYRLSRAAEYKDEAAEYHNYRVSEYSVALGRHMGVNKIMLENLLYAAPMHDVGKIGVPDHILLKPGKLSPEEWQIMKQHTRIGARILNGADSELLQMAELIALTHHEKWDGSGYPDGIIGTKIPLAGRIVGLADVFDSLLMKRPFRESMMLDQAYEIIHEERGKHFDPEVVDAFFIIKNELLAIKDAY